MSSIPDKLLCQGGAVTSMSALKVEEITSETPERCFNLTVNVGYTVTHWAN